MSGLLPLTGRDKERTELANLLDDAASPTVLISGVAGIGKTRLVADVTADRARVRWVRGSPAAFDVPLGAFAEYVDPAIEDPLRRLSALVAAMRSEIGPSLVVVDDLQSLDPMSVYVVEILARSVDVQVVVIMREGSGAGSTDELIGFDGLRRLEVVRHIELGPLTRTAVDELVMLSLGVESASDLCGQAWRLSQGNPLYLTSLLADADALMAGAASSVVSPGLRDLVLARIGEVDGPVADLLDVVALAEPLDHGVAVALTDAETVECAEQMELITVDRTANGGVRLAHPLYGDVRRAVAGEARLRRLRGRIVTEFERSGRDGDQQSAVRCAVLAVKADGLADRDRLLTDGALAAMGLLALPLALELAAEVGRGPHRVQAQLIVAHVLTIVGSVEPARAVLAALWAESMSVAQAETAMLLEVYLTLWSDNDIDRVRTILTQTRGRDCGVAVTVTEALLATVTAQIDTADRMLASLTSVRATDFGHVTRDWAHVAVAGELGRMREVDQVAQRAHVMADRSPVAGYWRLTLCDAHIRVWQVAGAGDRVRQVGEEALARVPDEAGAVRGWLTGFRGVAAAADGDLRTAASLLDAALRIFDDISAPAQMWYCFAIDRAEVAVELGDLRTYGQIRERLDGVSVVGYGFRTLRLQAVVAMAEAAGGALSVGVDLAGKAAAQARRHGQSAHEVYCLQTMVRLGGGGAWERLAELAESMPELPRAQLAARHAAALAAGDADALAALVAGYTAHGAPGLAADAAAQAALIHRSKRRAGAALTVLERASSLADEHGVDTPTLRLARRRDGLTRRQREIVNLAAQGLSNKEIADRLVVSVRTVEGHLYRASQILGGAIRR